MEMAGEEIASTSEVVREAPHISHWMEMGLWESHAAIAEEEGLRGKVVVVMGMTPCPHMRSALIIHTPVRNGTR